MGCILLWVSQKAWTILWCTFFLFEVNKHLFILCQKVCKLWRQIQVTYSDKEECSDQKSKKKNTRQEQRKHVGGSCTWKTYGFKGISFISIIRNHLECRNHWWFVIVIFLFVLKCYRIMKILKLIHMLDTNMKSVYLYWCTPLLNYNWLQHVSLWVFFCIKE